MTSCQKGNNFRLFPFVFCNSFKQKKILLVLFTNTDKMDKAFFTDKVLPHVIAIAVFFIVTIAFFHPIFFNGKTLDQNDVNQGKGSAAEIVEYREETGEEALWTNSMFGGMPAYLINLYWSGEVVSKTIEKVYSLFLQPSLKETFIAFLSFYILLLAFGVRQKLAVIGALAYGLNTFFIISLFAGHLWKVRAIAYMPLVIAGIHLAFNRKLLLALLTTSVGLTLELLSNHFQITYYLFLVVLVYGIVELIYHVKEGKIVEFGRATGILVLAVVIAVGANMGRVWTTYEYGKYSTRGPSELTVKGDHPKSGLDREYAFHWSSGKWESLTLLVPHLLGGASGQYEGSNSELADVLRQNNVPRNQIEQYERGLLGYWGSQPGTAGPVYSGVIVAFLFVLGIFFADRKIKIWLVSAFIIGVVLSWGKNFPSLNNLMFDLFPGYNKFRSVSMTVVMSTFAMCLLGFVGLESFLKSKRSEKDIKNFFISSGIVIGLLLLIAIFVDPASLEGDQIPKAIKEAVHSDRLSIVRTDVFRSVFYVVAAVAIIFFFIKSKLKELAFSLLLGVLVLLDLWLVDTRYVGEENYISPSKVAFFQPSPADERVNQDKSIYRVLNLRNPFNDASTSNFHFSIGGYHGAKMKRYADLIEHQLQHEIQGIVQSRGLNEQNTNMLSALNTKYLISDAQENGVIENPYANGNAWFVKEVFLVNSPDEEIEALDMVGLDSVAVVDRSKFDVENRGGIETGSINLIDYQPNELTYKSSNSGDGLAVFSEIYYPKGWSATIDGSPVDILRADYVLRALQIPKGDHEIVFKFVPASYFVGNKIVLVANLLLLIVIGSVGYLVIKKQLSPTVN